MPDWGDKYSKVMDRLGALQNYISNVYMENVDVEHLGCHPDGVPGIDYTAWTPFTGGWAINGTAGFKYLNYLFKVGVTKSTWYFKARLMANFLDESQVIHFNMGASKWHNGVKDTLFSNEYVTWTSPATTFAFEEKDIKDGLSISEGDIVHLRFEKKGDVNDGDHVFIILGVILDYT